MKTLSVRQPLAHLLCAGVKDIDNRTWKLPEKYKGETVLIHASAKSANFWKTPKAFIVHKELAKIPIHEFDRTTRLYSAIIGSVRFVDCVINHPSIWAEKTEVYNEWCKANGCENYIEWSTGHGDCVSCKIVGQSYNIDTIAERCLFKKNAKKPVYNWVVADPILFDKPILNVKGKLSFWDYDLPDEYVKLINDYDNGKKDL